MTLRKAPAQLIPLVRPLIPEMDLVAKYFKASAAAGQFSNFGPCFEASVRALGAYLGRLALPVTNGTAAIQLALQTQLRPGSRVGLSDFTHIGTLNAIYAARCVPVFFGAAHFRDWCLSGAELISFRKHIDGFIVTSPFGQPVDTDKYDDLAQHYNLRVVYDFAGAWGLPLRTHNPVCFSFHATKNFSIGEGGAVAFSRDEDWEKGRELSNFDINPRHLDRYVQSPWGSNLKLDELRCAQILAHLEKHELVQKRIAQKRRAQNIYRAELSDYAKAPEFEEPWCPSLCVFGGLPSREIERASPARGFVTRKYYPLLTRMPALREVERVSESSSFFDTTIALPSDVDDVEMDWVINQIIEIMSERNP